MDIYTKAKYNKPEQLSFQTFLCQRKFKNASAFLNNAWERVEIHKNTSIAYGVTVSASSHEIGMPEKLAEASRRRPVIIGEGCWIGANVTILPGVTVADGCVIGAGSVVTRSTEKNESYLGIPAKRVRTL